MPVQSVVVTLRRNSDGVTKTIQEHAKGVQDADSALWWWLTGNGACDCNRALSFGDEEPCPDGYCECHGKNYYSLLDCVIDGVSLGGDR